MSVQIPRQVDYCLYIRVTKTRCLSFTRLAVILSFNKIYKFLYAIIGSSSSEHKSQTMEKIDKVQNFSSHFMLLWLLIKNNEKIAGILSTSKIRNWFIHNHKIEKVVSPLCNTIHISSIIFIPPSPSHCLPATSYFPRFSTFIDHPRRSLF